MSATTLFAFCGQTSATADKESANTDSVRHKHGVVIGISKSWRGVYPQHPRFPPPGIFPAMWRGTFKIQTVAGLKLVMVLAVQPDMKLAAEYMKKFFAFVRIRFAATATRLDPEEVRLHDGLAPGEEFHAHVRSGFKNFSLRGAHEARIFTRSLKEGKDIGAVETGNAAKRGNGGAHLAAFEGAQKSHGNAGGSRDLSKREAPASAQAAEALSGHLRNIRGRGDHALTFQDVDDRRWIEAAGAAKKNCTL